jgi:hypothetical protein
MPKTNVPSLLSQASLPSNVTVKWYDCDFLWGPAFPHFSHHPAPPPVSPTPDMPVMKKLFGREEKWPPFPAHWRARLGSLVLLTSCQPWAHSVDTSWNCTWKQGSGDGLGQGLCFHFKEPFYCQNSSSRVVPSSQASFCRRMGPQGTRLTVSHLH